LSLAVLMLWFYLFPAPPALPGKGSPESAAPPISTGAQAPAPLPPSAKAAAPESAKPAAPREDIAATSEERVVLERDAAKAVFTNRGAQLVSLQLKGSKT